MEASEGQTEQRVERNKTSSLFLPLHSLGVCLGWGQVPSEGDLETKCEGTSLLGAGMAGNARGRGGVVGTGGGEGKDATPGSLLRGAGYHRRQ